MVKDASNMSYDELVSWAEEEAEIQTPKKKVVTPKKKVVEHVIDDVDIPLMNLVESPKLKRILLGRNSPIPIAKRKLMGKVTSPTSYVVNKGRSVLNEGNTVKKSTDKGKSTMDEDASTVKKTVEKGKSTMVKDANTVKKAVDKGKGKMVEEERHVRIPVRRNKATIIEDNVNPSVENDTDSESDPAQGINYSLYSDSDSDSKYSDKSVDYLSEGEDELIELRKRKTEANNEPKVRKQQTQAAKEGTSSGVRKKRQYVVGDYETVIEHEGFMDDLLRKLSQDNGNVMTEFHIVETKVEKYPIHDVDTHWRMRKPKVGDLFVDIEQLKECLAYYALANRFSLWFYISSKTMLIAKCGLWLEKIKDPKLGKQSKFKRSKSLITMLEAIKVIVLERMHIMRNLCDKWTADICPNIQKRLEITKDQHRFWHVIPTGGHLFEVGNGSEAFGVDEERRNCTCRLWQLLGLPCCHAVAVIFKLNSRGNDLLADCSDMSRVLPPKPRTMAGRPRKKRIRPAHENKNPNKEASYYKKLGGELLNGELPNGELPNGELLNQAAV
ncbi:pentatricopeptide repeat-containing protein [Tanacetum coccineum]